MCGLMSTSWTLNGGIVLDCCLEYKFFPSMCNAVDFAIKFYNVFIVCTSLGLEANVSYK